MEEPILLCVELKILDRVGRVARADEQVVPLWYPVQYDAVEEAADDQIEQHGAPRARRTSSPLTAHDPLR